MLRSVVKQSGESVEPVNFYQVDDMHSLTSY